MITYCVHQIKKEVLQKRKKPCFGAKKKYNFFKTSSQNNFWANFKPMIF